MDVAAARAAAWTHLVGPCRSESEPISADEPGADSGRSELQTGRPTEPDHCTRGAFPSRHWRRRLAAVLDVALSFLVYLAPFALLALLTMVLEGAGDWGHWRRGRPLPVPQNCSQAASGRPEPPVLASDAERDQTLEHISYAVGEGRLTLDEAEQRIGAVLHSRHRHELTELVGDLPHEPQSDVGVKRWESRRPPCRPRLVLAAAVLVIMAVLVQAITGIWALWPVVAAACGFWAADHRHRTASQPG